MQFWDYYRIDQKLASEIASNSTLVLPLATLIETGNHIAKCNGDRFEVAQRFCEVLRHSIDSKHPWAAFSEQSELWNSQMLAELADKWPEQAAGKVSLGDATIIEVANYYAKAFSNREVEIFTGDYGLKSYERKITDASLIPRRRR